MDGQSSQKNITAIVLAAGSSSRLGQSKQLLKSKNTPLIVKTVSAAIDANVSKIIVVLGHNFFDHKLAIDHLPVEIVVNEKWQLGMGSSLKAGITHALEDNPDTSAIIVLVCDQPHLNSQHIKTLINTFEATQSPIVASHYNDTSGVPALFSNFIFPELLTIDNHQGAKSLFHKHQSNLTAVQWPEGTIDIDTPEDLKHL
jgi:molybdenum cofactor cytidylyltransferase